MRKSPPPFSRDLTLTKVCHVMDVDIATDPVGTLQANANFNAIVEDIEATNSRIRQCYFLRHKSPTYGRMDLHVYVPVPAGEYRVPFFAWLQLTITNVFLLASFRCSSPKRAERRTECG